MKKWKIKKAVAANNWFIFLFTKQIIFLIKNIQIVFFRGTLYSYIEYFSCKHLENRSKFIYQSLICLFLPLAFSNANTIFIVN